MSKKLSIIRVHPNGGAEIGSDDKYYVTSGRASLILSPTENESPDAYLRRKKSTHIVLK